MDDLTKCLYNFVCEKRMGTVHQNPEYRAAARNVERQTEKVEKSLSKKQQRELRLLMDNMNALSSIESEHLFRAALGLAQELGRVAGAS